MKQHHNTAIIIIAILAFCSVLANCEDNLFKSEENNEYFIQPAQKYTWQEAFDECDTKDMDLLIIDSEAKAIEIKVLLKKIFTSKPIPRFYLAANDLEKVNEFHWITKKERKPVIYTNWEPNEPNKYQKLNERCIHIGFHGTDQWNDITCSRKYGFICQERTDLKSLLNKMDRA
ncbi:C-type lectin mosGCTL-7-like [Cochliomyia hominivorax]